MTEVPETNVSFDEERHIYTLRGVRMPSVTQIMKPLTSLIYDGVPSPAMMVAANRGTRVHESCEKIIKYGITEFDEDTEPYVKAFQDFADTFHPIWIASEYRTYHKQLRYAGTMDVMCYVEPDDGNGVDIFDIKTTASWHSILLATQLAAYEEALKSHGIKVRNTYGLQLQKTGKFRFEKVESQFKVFLHCLGVYNAAAYELT